MPKHLDGFNVYINVQARQDGFPTMMFDEDQFEEFVKETYKMVYLWYVAKSCPNSEDLIQEVYLRIWRSSLKSWDARYSFLWKTVNSVLADYFRKPRRRLPDMSIDELDLGLCTSEDPVLENAEKAEIKQKLIKALSRLPDKLRMVIFMHLWGGLSFTIIAKTLQKPRSKVYKLWLRALEILRGELPPDFFEESNDND